MEAARGGGGSGVSGGVVRALSEAAGHLRAAASDPLASMLADTGQHPERYSFGIRALSAVPVNHSWSKAMLGPLIGTRETSVSVDFDSSQGDLNEISEAPSLPKHSTAPLPSLGTLTASQVRKPQSKPTREASPKKVTSHYLTNRGITHTSPCFPFSARGGPRKRRSPSWMA